MKDQKRELRLTQEPRNIYLALLFEDRPDLHMTVQYLKGLDNDRVGEYVRDVDRFLEAMGALCPSEMTRFTLELPIEGWFGPGNTIRALEPSLDFKFPMWINILGSQVWLPEIQTPWVPHVTCDDPEQLTLEVSSVAVMHKKKELARWDIAP